LSPLVMYLSGWCHGIVTRIPCSSVFDGISFGELQECDQYQ